MKVLTVQISDELHSHLFDAAAEQDKSASLFVREAIREKIARATIKAVPDLPAASRRTRTKKAA